MLKLKPVNDMTNFELFRRGAALPGMIVFGCALFGLISGLLGEASAFEAAKLGIFVGLFFSIFAGIELAVTIAISQDKFRHGLWIFLGYITVWALAITIISIHFSS